jgi:hypothetical protein
MGKNSSGQTLLRVNNRLSRPQNCWRQSDGRGAEIKALGGKTGARHGTVRRGNRRVSRWLSVERLDQLATPADP